MFMLRVQANQCKIDSFAISLNTKKRSHVSKYGSMRAWTSLRTRTDQPAPHTHTFRSCSLAPSRSLPFSLYACETHVWTEYESAEAAVCVQTLVVWKSMFVCVSACVYITFESCMNCALSHRYAHTIERESKIFSFDVQQRAPSLGISVHLVLLLLYLLFVTKFCSLDVDVIHEPKTTFSRWILRIDTLRRYTINCQYMKMWLYM